ncbi:uncharacterized protein EI90DRAFT_3127267 [Cantharellus anzutake]|uniref:uncharacterized protein n=1 Tax=Cantharellus anzutake TaxID=1750568 RepID=UPI0019061A69|nr:uncharacterized protein EI90DRAFT_3127267 [Cantharellus anzutake]KAF8327214.1 hypothetical protein EI90DRAFT_3127267 [Cantharellus anzutake]
MRSPAKPLPYLPSGPAVPESGVPPLTPQAHDHLRKVIARGVEDEDLPTSWVSLVLHAVLEMGKTVASETSLEGVRRMKLLNRRVVRDLEIGAGVAITGDRLAAPEEYHYQGIRPRSPFRSRGVGVKDHNGEEDIQGLLALHERVSHSAASSSSPSMHHLLITLAPLTVFSHYSLVGRPACTFHANRFELPQFESLSKGWFGTGAVDITGIESWKTLYRRSLNSGSDIRLEDVHVIGGCFSVSHLSSEVYDSLVKVLRLSVYTYLSILIELSFLRDSGVKLEYVLSPPLPSIPLPPVEPIPKGRLHLIAHTKEISRRGLWSFITKKTADFRNLRPRSIFASRHSITDSPPLRTAELPSPTMAPPPTAIGVIPVSSIQHESSIFSTSHSVKPEPPPIIVRLSNEEGESEAKVGGETPSKARHRKRLTGADKVTLSTILGWKSDGTGFGNVHGFLKHQAITVLYSSHMFIMNRVQQTYRYYDETYETLGAWIQEVSSQAQENPHTGEVLKYTWCHSTFMLTADVHRAPEATQEVGPDEDTITTYLSCNICDANTTSVKLENASLLLDFGKYLELVFYSKELTNLSIPLCSHTSTLGSTSESSHLMPQLNLTRHYKYHSIIISFRLSSIGEDMYNAQIPRTQVLKSLTEVVKKEHPFSSSSPSSWGDTWLREEREKIRLDMTFIWKALKDYLLLLEEDVLSGFGHKQLPTPPPTESPEDITPTRSSIQPSGSSESPSTSRSSPVVSKSSRASFTLPGTISTSVSTSSIAGLKSLIHSAERSLYVQLSESSIDSLNNVRRAFISSASDAQQRLYGLLPPDEIRVLDEPMIPLPEWWQKGVHCLPDSSVVVRENDLGSLIAFTLRSPEYRSEVQEMSLNSNSSGDPPTIMKAVPSIGRRTSSFTWKSLSHPPSPASYPGFHLDGSLKHKDSECSSILDPEDFSAGITRMENPRDASSLLSFPSVLLRRRSHDESGASSKFATLGTAASRISGITSPAAAWSKPDVRVSLNVGRGVVSAGTGINDSSGTKHPESSDNQTSESVARVDSATLSPSSSRHVKQRLPSELSTTTIRPNQSPPDAQEIITPHSSAEAPTAPLAEDAPYRLALLGPDQNVSYPKIDERPHLKYEFVIGRRLHISCTVYYALQFAVLRKQCGVEDALIRSLERTAAWVAEGGKSRSTFFKTSDNRFILKTMVSSWNVADLPAILEMAPAYFAYVGQGHDKTSALTKLLGFYTVEIKNLETGLIENKADLLVMENLFYSQDVVESFDLKGIKGRKIKDLTANVRTLFDQEWMDKQRHSPLYLHPQSKHVLQESLNADVDFLCESNVMDYSLLVGIDKLHKELTCGLVDTFGTYTFAKTLESKAKQGLKTDKEKEITVVPPSEYRARFLKAVDKYFLSVPDKWTKPLNGFFTPGEFFRATQVL